MFGLNLASFLLQGQGGTGLLGLVPIAFGFAFLYFFMIVPQRNRQRQLQSMREALKVGDSVVMMSGIYGTITRVREGNPAVQLCISEDPLVRINVARDAIAGLAAPPNYC
jgi:preprotein translocase subunit YajC